MRMYTMSKRQLLLLVKVMNTIGPNNLRQFPAGGVARLRNVQAIINEEDHLTFNLPQGAAAHIIEQINLDTKKISSMPVITNEEEELLGELSDLKVVLKRHFQIV